MEPVICPSAVSVLECRKPASYRYTLTPALSSGRKYVQAAQYGTFLSGTPVIMKRTSTPLRAALIIVSYSPTSGTKYGDWIHTRLAALPTASMWARLDDFQ